MDAFNDEEVPNNSEQQKNRKRRLSVQEDNCIICLQRIQDRAILPQCSHDSQCFSCLLEWTKHSTKCPLCVSDIGPFIIHNVRSKHDYKRYFISPTLSPTSLSQSRPLSESRRVAHYQLRREERWRNENDAAIHRRRHIYNSGLFAKHVASNRYTGYTPHPTPAQISASIELQRRARTFLRRELRVWINLDLEFLMNYIIALIKTLDLRSEAGIKLLADLMDPGYPYSEETRKPNTEHLAHELLSFLRSPYKQVEAYDEIVQYDSAPSLNHRSVRQAAPYNQSRRNRSMSPPHAPARRTSDRYMRENMKSTGTLRDEEGGREAHFSQPDSQLLAPQRSIEPSTSEPPKSQTPNIPEPARENADIAPFTSLISQTSAHPPDSQASLMKRIRSEISRQRDMNLNVDPDDEPTATVPSSERAPASPVPGHLSAARREELLANLNKEKARMQVSQTVDTNMDDVSPTDGAQVSGGLQIRGAAAKARELMEKKLRAQALLRVKLARERSRLAEARAAVEAEPIEPRLSPLTRAGTSGDVAKSGGSTEAVDEKTTLQHKLRERLLRERLLLARAKPLGAST